MAHAHPKSKVRGQAIEDFFRAPARWSWDKEKEVPSFDRFIVEEGLALKDVKSVDLQALLSWLALDGYPSRVQDLIEKKVRSKLSERVKRGDFGDMDVTAEEAPPTRCPTMPAHARVLTQGFATPNSTLPIAPRFSSAPMDHITHPLHVYTADASASIATAPTKDPSLAAEPLLSTPCAPLSFTHKRATTYDAPLSGAGAFPPSNIVPTLGPAISTTEPASQYIAVPCVQYGLATSAPPVSSTRVFLSTLLPRASGSEGSTILHCSNPDTVPPMESPDSPSLLRSNTRRVPYPIPYHEMGPTSDDSRNSGDMIDLRKELGEPKARSKPLVATVSSPSPAVSYAVIQPTNKPELPRTAPVIDDPFGHFSKVDSPLPGRLLEAHAPAAVPSSIAVRLSPVPSPPTTPVNANSIKVGVDCSPTYDTCTTHLARELRKQEATSADAIKCLTAYFDACELADQQTQRCRRYIKGGQQLYGEESYSALYRAALEKVDIIRNADEQL